jgi:LytS/YehU family sensor histidine kinase
LEKELLFIENYIELEALRVEDVAEIKFIIDGDPEGIKIPPLLFIPLIENAFKHGVVSELDKSLIKIEISVVSDSIGLQIENPWEEDEQDDLSKHKGLGVENVQKRLSLLYPNKYILKCERQGKSYITDLKIKL